MWVEQWATNAPVLPNGRLPSAYSTAAPTPVIQKPPLGVCVTMDTVCSQNAIGSPTDILLCGNWLKVFRSDTSRYTAEVIELQSVGNRSSMPFVGKSVDSNELSIPLAPKPYLDLGISIRVHRPLPQPTLARQITEHLRPKTSLQRSRLYGHRNPHSVDTGPDALTSRPLHSTIEARRW